MTNLFVPEADIIYQAWWQQARRYITQQTTQRQHVRLHAERLQHYRGD